jgi:hypothetical protein
MCINMWVKGKSGNASGLSKEAHQQIGEIRKLARSKCLKAIMRMAELIDSSNERVALAAAEAILDRGIGKPQQEIAVSDATVQDLPMGELATRAAALLAIHGRIPSLSDDESDEDKKQTH